MHHRASRQRGMTLISFLLLFAMIGSFILVGLKLTPIYLEHFKIKTTLENLKSEPELAEKSPKEIIATLQKRWDINSINRITAADSVTIEASGGSLTVQAEYEVEEPIVANVSALVRFKDSVTLGK
jgi:hypothetical protein